MRPPLKSAGFTLLLLLTPHLSALPTTGTTIVVSHQTIVPNSAPPTPHPQLRV